MAATAGTTMGRPKGKRTERNDSSVKIDRAVAAMAGAVAKYEGTNVAAFLSEILRPVVEKRYAAMLRKLEEGKP